MKDYKEILILDEGVPFGNRYGIFYNENGTSICLDYDETLKRVNELAQEKHLTKENIFSSLNVTFKNLYSLEHPDETSFYSRRDLRDQIYECDNRLKEKYNRVTDELKITHLTSMYYYDPHSKEKIDKNTIKDYEKTKKYILNVCKKEHIEFEKDPDKIIHSIIDEFTKKKEKYYPDVSECTSQEAIINNFNSKSKDVKSLKEEHYDFKKRRLVEYTATYFNNDYRLAKALSDKTSLTRKEVLKSWAEFMIALPKYCEIMNTLKECDNKLYDLEQQEKLNEFYQNDEFITNLRELLNHDEEKEDYYYHATFSGNVDSILDNGLFLGSSELESTATPGLSEKSVLSYAYGDGGLGQADDCVVVLRKPKEENIVREATEEEKNKCSPFSRRFLVSIPLNNYVIDKKYIAGVVDKKNKIVYNNKQYFNDLDTMFESTDQTSSNNSKKK